MVAGASSGIGAAVARVLSREGMHVALAARREPELLRVQASLEGRDGARSLVSIADVTDRGQVKNLVARTEEELGPVDVLVNCAGVMYFTMMKNLREDEWERTVDVLCKGMLNCVGSVIGGMLDRGRGHIVTISSDAGRKVFPGLAALLGRQIFRRGRLPGAAPGDRRHGAQDHHGPAGQRSNRFATNERGRRSPARVRPTHRSPGSGPRGRGRLDSSCAPAAGTRRRQRGVGGAPRRARIARGTYFK